MVFSYRGDGIKKLFGIFIGLVMLMPMTATAECVSTDSITKCARLPTCFGYCRGANYTNQVSDPDGVSWSYYREGIPISGTSQGYSSSKIIASATCVITSPFNATVKGSMMLGGNASTGGGVCSTPDLWEASSMDVLATALDGDTCPDGFFTVPYEYSCGVGMVNTADVPNCADDMSGEYCLMPQVKPCSLGISALKTSSGLSFALYAEKYTTPAINIGYNGGICYANLEPGQSAGAINVSYNDQIYHTVE